MKLLSADTKATLFPDSDFWKKILRFSIPVALQNMSTGILGVLDVSIISALGETAVAAVSLANQLVYIVTLIAFGITSGASVYLSRYYGEKNAPAMRQTFTIMTFFTLLVNTLIMLFCLIFPRLAMSFFTDDAETIAGGAIYLLIVAPHFLFYSISSAFVSFFRSVNMPRIPMVATILSLIVKTVLNIVLIYGFWFIPEMGIAGAAVSTLVSKIVEFSVYIYYILRFKEKEYVFRLSDLKFIKPKASAEFIKLTYPVIINESLWGIGISMFSAVFGRMGNVTVTAVSVAQQLENLCNSFFYGIGIGACVSLSFSIGEGKFDEAEAEAKKYAAAGFYVGIGIMLLMFIINVPYVDIFFSGLENATKTLAKILVVVYAVYMPFRSLSSALIMGVQRAGGDSKRAMLYDILPIYIWSLPLGFVLGIKFNFSIIVVLSVMQFKRFIKCILALRRLLSGKWINYDEIGALRR